jgi:DNA-binding Lrp family transcriptional regulator
MKPTDKVDFAKVMAAMASHKGKTLSVMDHELWWGGMQDWTLADFQAAAIHLLKNAEFMPTMKSFEDLRKAGRMTAGEAWDIAVKHASSSAYRGGPLNDAKVDQCVRIIGGYEAIAQCDVSKLQFLERRFCEHYETIEDATDTRAAVPQIAERPNWLNLRLDSARLTRQ